MSVNKSIKPIKPSVRPSTPIRKSPSAQRPVKPVPSSPASGTPQRFSENR